uniref:Uncharacterized protein n=1 Tax=Spongospora subterranea TaxID=70186 RepID=A0A0H5RT42_9EUKA|eukprot:CRZ11904.1 hypothetical protein [Spongospora subterranea]
MNGRGQMVQEAHAAMAEALHRAAEVVSPQESANLTEEPAPGIAERTKNLIQEAVESTKQALHVGKEAGQETIEGEKPGVTERIKQAVQGAKDNAQETVERVQPGVAEHLKSGLATMRDRTKEAGPEIIDRIKQVIPPAEKGKQVWEEGKVKVKQGLDSAKSMAPSPGEAYETMSESVSGAVKSGKEAISKISTSTSQRGDVAGGCNVPGGLGLSPVPGAASYAGVGSPTGATEPLE